MEKKSRGMDAMITYVLPCLITAIICCILFYFFIKKNISSLLKIFTEKTFIENSLDSSPLENMRSDILKQFDEFMQNRLTTEMPVLKMFVDDKLISELKTVFEKELTTILPEVIKKNISSESILNSQLFPIINRSMAKKFLGLFCLVLLSSVLIGVLFMILLT